ncbi:MAG: dockerin type I domain-containing protein [Oscillospiraceae bacterium]|nr:dockerin type I domain-containing protein [Oscillospiraceae bacterium]
MPEGWLLWHSYSSYENMDSHLYIRNDKGNINEITGNFIHAMNGNFGNRPDLITFMAIDQTADEWDIFLYDNGRITNLTKNSGFRNEDPKWLPDGKTIVFKRGFWNTEVNDFTYNLALLNPSTLKITMLTDSLAEEAMPCFSQDGDSVYYTEYSNGIGSIMKMDMQSRNTEIIWHKKGVNAYYPIYKNHQLYFTKWISNENHHDMIMKYTKDGFQAQTFNSDTYDCSDACPIDETCMIYSCSANGTYSLYYYDGTDSVEISGIPGEGNALGADFFRYQPVPGDVNNDKICSVADAVMLQKWLLSMPDTILTDWEAGDITKDHQLNSIDLSALIHLLIE